MYLGKVGSTVRKDRLEVCRQTHAEVRPVLDGLAGSSGQSGTECAAGARSVPAGDTPWSGLPVMAGGRRGMVVLTVRRRSQSTGRHASAGLIRSASGEDVELRAIPPCIRAATVLHSGPHLGLCTGFQDHASNAMAGVQCGTTTVWRLQHSTFAALSVDCSGVPCPSGQRYSWGLTTAVAGTGWLAPCGPGMTKALPGFVPRRDPSSKHI